MLTVDTEIDVKCLSLCLLVFHWFLLILFYGSLFFFLANCIINIITISVLEGLFRFCLNSQFYINKDWNIFLKGRISYLLCGFLGTLRENKRIDLLIWKSICSCLKRYYWSDQSTMWRTRPYHQDIVQSYSHSSEVGGLTLQHWRDLLSWKSAI